MIRSDMNFGCGLDDFFLQIGGKGQRTWGMKPPILCDRSAYKKQGPDIGADFAVVTACRSHVVIACAQ